jgi:hypothetical protein
MRDRRRGDRKHRLLAIFGLLASFSLGFFVWPTPWRHDRVGRTPVRTHRVTGMVEILNLQGWQPALSPFEPRRVVRFRPRPVRVPAPCEAPEKQQARPARPIAVPAQNAT